MVDKAFVGFVGILLTSKIFACSSELDKDKYKEELFDKLPFFEDLVRDQNRSVNGSVFYNIVVNNNFFWIPENVHRRMEFHEDIKKVEAFEVGDPVYDAILARINTGDAYGIIKPVARVQNEPFNEDGFQKACAHFFLSPPERANFREDGYYKLIECWKKGRSRDDLYNWVTYERLLGTPINFLEYKVVDETIYGDVSELLGVYETQEFDSVVSNTKAVLRSWRLCLEDTIDEFVSSINEHWNSGRKEFALEKYRELVAIHECREGDSDEEKARQQKNLYELEKILPQEFLSYCLSNF